jgi:hypothetical protein
VELPLEDCRRPEALTVTESLTVAVEDRELEAEGDRL